MRLATGAAGIKYKGRTDVLFALFDKGTTVAGVFTRSKCPSAPVEWCRAKLKGGKARALVVNSGNANAFTGKTGRAAVAFTAKLAAQGRGLQAGGGFSRLDRRDRRAAAGGALRRRAGQARQQAAPGRFLEAAKAIMTTDTFPKVATATREARRGDGDDQRHRQGRRHDRARHGDDAVLRVHRRADRGAGPAGDPVGCGHRYVQRRDDRRRHVDVRYAARIRDRRRARARRRSPARPIRS